MTLQGQILLLRTKEPSHPIDIKKYNTETTISNTAFNIAQHLREKCTDSLKITIQKVIQDEVNIKILSNKEIYL